MGAQNFSRKNAGQKQVKVTTKKKKKKNPVHSVVIVFKCSSSYKSIVSIWLVNIYYIYYILRKSLDERHSFRECGVLFIIFHNMSIILCSVSFRSLFLWAAAPSDDCKYISFKYFLQDLQEYLAANIGGSHFPYEAQAVLSLLVNRLSVANLISSHYMRNDSSQWSGKLIYWDGVLFTDHSVSTSVQALWCMTSAGAGSVWSGLIMEAQTVRLINSEGSAHSMWECVRHAEALSGEQLGLSSWSLWHLMLPQLMTED